MVIAYVVVGLAVAAAASVLSDRFRTNAGGAALLAGALWPVVLIGAAQVMLWTAGVHVLSRFSRRRAARRECVQIADPR